MKLELPILKVNTNTAGIIISVSLFLVSCLFVSLKIYQLESGWMSEGLRQSRDRVGWLLPIVDICATW